MSDENDVDVDVDDDPRPPMLDPEWTPERGYSHALKLLEALGDY